MMLTITIVNSHYIIEPQYIAINIHVCTHVQCTWTKLAILLVKPHRQWGNKGGEGEEEVGYTQLVIYVSQ